MKEYSLLVGLGASLAVLRVVQQVPRWQALRWANAALQVLFGCLAGARLFYVGGNWTYFSKHLLETLMFWSGGLSWFGAASGGIAAVFFLYFRWRVSLWKLLDGLCPMIPPLVISSLLGSWMLGIAYGPEMPAGFIFFSPVLESYGQLEPRLPIQFGAALAMLIFAFWLETKKKRFEHEGMKAILMGLGSSVVLLLFTLLRADPAPVLLGQRIDFWAAFFVFLFNIGLLLFVVLHSQKTIE